MAGDACRSGEEARSAYKCALLGTDADDRKHALTRLVSRGDEAAAALIGDALLESNWPVCNELAGALADLGSDPARDALLRALKARRHHIRSAAIKALARLRGAGVREAIESLRDDPSYEVRQDVVDALSRLAEEGD